MTSTSDWERAQRKLENRCLGCGVDLADEIAIIDGCDECHDRLVIQLRENIRMLDSMQANDRRYIQVSLETVAALAAALADKK